MRKLITVLGVIAAAALSLNPKDLRRGIPARGSFSARKTVRGLAFVAAAGLLFSACGEKELRAGALARGLAAREGKTELSALVRDQLITGDEAASVRPIIERLEKTSESADQRLVGFDRLDGAGKLTLVSGFVDDGAEIAADFDALKIKNEKGRQRINRIVGHVRRANAAFRIVRAAIPPKN
ncbi:MAG TPA: hypothetical protein VGX48_18690 [Pyrinomonadaceae bacterium]|nr:hypothetical protein [Pyrinomonadaceae bacterium]